MSKALVKFGLLVALMAFAPLCGQSTANSRMPPVVDMTRNGWDVSLQNGNLTLALPVANVPGEVPIPVSFGFNGTYIAQGTPVKTIVRDPETGQNITTTTMVEIDRPVAGAIHFGYISNPSTKDGVSIKGLTVLEDGKQIYSGGWTAFSAHPEMGTSLNLPQAYGFLPVPTSSALVDSTATYVWYQTTAAGLGAKSPNYSSIVQGLIPSGFGTALDSYVVVMDKNRARVFAKATSLNCWVPVLWADRFGHYVTFQWTRATTGLAPGLTAITKVTALNQRSKGVALRWAEYASNASNVDILRLDYIGMNAPSMVVNGYPGVATVAPTAFQDLIPFDVESGVVVPSVIGSLCRPMEIKIGATGNLLQPSWATPSGPGMAVSAGSAAADETVLSDTQKWTFEYDSNRAELRSYTDPRLLKTAFTFETIPFQDPTAPSYARGVVQVDCTDGSSVKNSMRWTRTFSGSKISSVKVEGWWDSNSVASPDRYHLITFPTDALHYGNGVYQVDSLKDSSGRVWSTTTYAYNPIGAGLSADLSGVQSVAVWKDGAPTITTTYGYSSSASIQTTSVDVSGKDNSGKNYKISSTVNTYATRWDMMEGYQATQVVSTRYAPDGVTALPPVTQKQVWDNAVSGIPLLQQVQSYLDAGAVGRHGITYSYDNEGRPHAQSILHFEGTTDLSGYENQTVSYDPACGAILATHQNDQIYPFPSLSQTQSGFDSWGRPKYQMDENGVTTTLAYDDRGRIVSKSRPGTPTISYEYPTELSVKQINNGQDAKSTYDGFGRLKSIETRTGLTNGPSGTPGYTTQTFGYDVYGRKTSQRDINPAGSTRIQSWEFDPLDRVTGHTPVAGNRIGITYSVSGLNLNQVTTTTLSNGSTSTTHTDPFGQTVVEILPDQSYTQASFDQFGNRTSLTTTDVYGNVQTRNWYYDALGRMISKYEPETNYQKFSEFNAWNQPTTITEWGNDKQMLDSGTRIRSIQYDGYGRTKQISNGQANTINTYTGSYLTGATRTIGGTTVSQTFVYGGPGGLLSSETTTQPNQSATIQYGYDSIGRLTTLTYPSNRVIGYGYDTLSRITSIQNNGTNLFASSGIKFDDWGNLEQTVYASASQDMRKSDLTGTRLSLWSIGYVGGGPDGRDYKYDDATNALKSAGEWTLLEHDARGRITKADGFGIKTTHTNDAFGNAITHSVSNNGNEPPTTFRNFAFNPIINNQIPGFMNTGAPTGWNTNGKGEATQVGSPIGNGAGLGIGWDGLGLVRSVGWSNGSQTYLYAPSGMRVSLADATTSTNNRNYTYTSQGQLLAEYKTSTGTPVWNRDVVYLGSQAIAEIDANGVHELHSDHLGSPRLITKGAGNWASNLVGTVDGTQAYGPYGETISQTGYLPLTGFTGHVQTDGSGLIYMRGRYYSPAWHAFLNSDQGVDQNSLNQRAYTGGSPFMRTDPSGNRWCMVRTTVIADSGGGPREYSRILWCFGDAGSGSGGGTAASSTTSEAPNDCHAFVEKLVRYGRVAQSASRFHAGSAMAADVLANSYASRGITRGWQGALASTASELYSPKAGVSGFQNRLVQYGQGSWAKAHIQGTAAMVLLGNQGRIDRQFAEDRAQLSSTAWNGFATRGQEALSEIQDNFAGLDAGNLLNLYGNGSISQDNLRNALRGQLCK